MLACSITPLTSGFWLLDSGFQDPLSRQDYRVGAPRGIQHPASEDEDEDE